MANLTVAKNAINLIAGKSTKITVSNTGTKRGSTAPIIVPGNCIMVYLTGYVVVNNPVSPSINFILEGGSAEWEGSLRQENIHPYYSPAQMTSLKELVDYAVSRNKNLYIDSELFIG